MQDTGCLKLFLDIKMIYCSGQQFHDQRLTPNPALNPNSNLNP